VLSERGGHRQQRGRLDHRHVAGQQQPARRVGTRGHAGGDGVAHAHCGEGLRHDDHIARGNDACCAGGQRLRDHHHHRQMAFDGTAQRAAQHAQVTETLFQLVRGTRESTALPCGQHYDGRTGQHARFLSR